MNQRQYTKWFKRDVVRLARSGEKSVVRTARDLRINENLLDRDFEVSEPYQVEVTYGWPSEGWLYLATVTELHSRRIVCWSISETVKIEPATDALETAIERRCCAPYTS